MDAASRADGAAPFRLCVLEVGAERSRVRRLHKKYAAAVAAKMRRKAGEDADAGEPVVALESTIISHGMPFPENLAMAREVEEVVRAAGAVPATVAVVGGAVRVGLDDDALEELAAAGPAKVRKCSRRDMALCAAQGALGATTVSGTMVAAEAAGIAVFVTGGIGGVHRGAHDGDAPTLDVSADLLELGRTPVAVVCAGKENHTPRLHCPS